MKMNNHVSAFLIAFAFLTAYVGNSVTDRKIDRERFLTECIISMEQAAPPEIRNADPPVTYYTVRNGCEKRLDDSVVMCPPGDHDL